VHIGAVMDRDDVEVLLLPPAGPRSRFIPSSVFIPAVDPALPDSSDE
jgi:hypothetical protein